MSRKVYGFCDAGCRYRVPTYEEYANIAALIPVEPDASGVYHLEEGKKYKIRSKVASGWGELAITIDWWTPSETIWTGTVDVNLPTAKPYVNEFTFSLLKAMGTETVYYLCNDDVTEVSTGSSEYINKIEVKVSNAAAVYLVNDDVEVVVSGADGADGADGKSAYEVAVANGFEGTEEEWLESVVRGADGEDGADGKSAYEVAVANGFEGTEEEWLASLKGEKGADGDAVITDGSVTVEKLAAYQGKVVRNMFGNMGIKFGTMDDTTKLFTEDDTSVHFGAYCKLEPSKTYYMKAQELGELSNFAPLIMYFYDDEGAYISNSYTWDGTFTTPANTAYGIYPVKSQSNSQRRYDRQPFQLLDEPITGIYPYGYEETLYAEDLTKERNLIEHIVGDQAEAISETIINYNSKTEATFVEVKGGDVFTTNLFLLTGEYYCDAECRIKPNYGTNGSGSFRVNNEVTGEPPATTSFTIPDGVVAVVFNANGGNYPNATQSAWFDLENPQIVRGTELIDNLSEGDNFRFEDTAETEIRKIAKEEATELMVENGVISPLNGKNWMLWGDSTSCYAGTNYPDYIAERTGCVIYNKAAAGSRVTANEDSGSPIVDLVINNINADMQVLTLIGGYNDRRSYDSSNPDWTWLGSMLNEDGTLNTDKTTFYGALNTIASKWFEVCPEATKAWFTIFPCGTNPNGEYETKINGIIKEVANYWCIPCFDLWNEVGLPVRLDYINETYYMNDRIHPNPEGNRVASTYIQKKLESIMI